MSKNSGWNFHLFGCFSTIGEKAKYSKAMMKQSSRLSFTDVSDIEDISISFGCSLYAFNMNELKEMTDNFSKNNFLGEGGFGPVYKGFMEKKLKPSIKAQTVAVKLLNLEGSQGHREWLSEVILLGQLRHPHLVKLIGYCCEKQQRVLIYEYMEGGSLENHLFRSTSIPSSPSQDDDDDTSSSCLPWLTRLKIAVGAAKGLAFLHGVDKPVIYRDFKSSNILLQADYTVKLSDFGLAKDGPEGEDTHVSTRVMGTHGYAAPEYIMTGHLTTKSDVYSFGVVLLELLTGRRALDKSRPVRERNLVDWARPFLRGGRRVDRIMDPSIFGQYSEEVAKKTAVLAHKCLAYNPKSRPSMLNVVETLEPLMEIKDLHCNSLISLSTMDDAEHEDDRKIDVEEKHRRRHRERYRDRTQSSGSLSSHSNTSLYMNYYGGRT